MFLRSFLALVTLAIVVNSNSNTLTLAGPELGTVGRNSVSMDHVQKGGGSVVGSYTVHAQNIYAQPHHQASGQYSEASINTLGSHLGQPITYDYYSHYPNSPSTYPEKAAPEYVPETEEKSGWPCSIFGLICDDENNRQGSNDDDESGAGAAGGLGIAGAVAAVPVALKGLKLLKFATKLLLLPILLPLLLIIAIPVFIAAWFLPVVPVLVTGARNARETLSEDCLKRISCEVSRISEIYEFEAPWMKEFLDKASFKRNWIGRFTRTGRAAATRDCSAYACRPVTALQKSLTMK